MVLAEEMDAASAAAALKSLLEETGSWRGEKGQKLSLAAGYALAQDAPALNTEELIGVSDQAMYADKANYYRKAGHDRRKKR